MRIRERRWRSVVCLGVMFGALSPASIAAAGEPAPPEPTPIVVSVRSDGRWHSAFVAYFCDLPTHHAGTIMACPAQLGKSSRPRLAIQMPGRIFLKLSRPGVVIGATRIDSQHDSVRLRAEARPHTITVRLEIDEPTRSGEEIVTFVAVPPRSVRHTD
jgi:hypothetical protein